jgi:hypothetical protein
MVKSPQQRALLVPRSRERAAPPGRQGLASHRAKGA